MKRILISGASIAGPTLAYWLEKYGFQTTVVERASELRLGGQNIDIQGPSRKVAQRMSIEQAIIDADTGEKGVTYIDMNGTIKAAFPKGKAVGLTSELEILRGDLVNILYNLTKDKATYLFGDFIISLTEGKEGIQVRFESGKIETFDLVIAADGVHSKTRELVLGKEPRLKYLGLYTSYFTIPKGGTDSDWANGTPLLSQD